MRRLEVDHARDGLGGLVGVRSYTHLPEQYRPPATFRFHDVLSPEEAGLLRVLWEFSSDLKLYETVSVPREIFQKVGAIWVL